MKKQIFKRKKVSLHSKLRTLIKLDLDIPITYVYADGSKVNKVLSEKFIKIRSKPRKVNLIVNDIYALCHDLKAKYFIV